MTNQEFEATLLSRIKAVPFQPFVIEFDDGDRVVVGQPEALSYIGGPSAIFFDPRSQGMLFHSVAVSRVIDLVPAASA